MQNGIDMCASAVRVVCSAMTTLGLGLVLGLGLATGKPLDRQTHGLAVEPMPMPMLRLCHSVATLALADDIANPNTYPYPNPRR